MMEGFDYPKRLQRVRAEMERRGIGLMFLPLSADVQYVTGIPKRRPDATETNQPGDWLLGVFIGLEGGPVCSVPRMSAAGVTMQVQDKPWVKDVIVIGDTQDPFPILQKVLSDMNLGNRKIAIGERAWTTFALPLSRLVNPERWVLASEIISPMRMIKEEKEIAVMKTAAQMCDTIMGNVLKIMRPGIREFDLAYEIDHQMVALGAEGTSFTTGVCFWTKGRKRPAAWNARSTNKVLSMGDSVTFDFGVVFEGYCSDFGRAVFVGEPTPEYCRIYDTVIRAQREAMAAMKAESITAEQADSIARSVIKNEGYGGYFLHRLGHGIGSTVHEPPFLSDGNKAVLQAGMTFTVEPSIYMLGEVGARVEDAVVVTPDGGVPLSEFPRELHTVG